MNPYSLVDQSQPLDQGDLIDACPIFRLYPTETVADLTAAPRSWLSRVVVSTQACDLAQSKAGKVLIAAIHTAQELIDEGVVKASVVRDQIRRGMVYGWYFLPASKGDDVMPESIIDLRELHTVSRLVLEKLVADGRRVARLMTPFREHLAQHFAVTYMRIGLPAPYETQP